MSEGDRCPVCGNPEMHRSEGRLDQCGLTYLPTTVWSCPACEFASYAPALAAHWQPTEAARSESVPSPAAPTRRAA